MSDSATDAGTAEFNLLWKRVSTLCGSKTQNKKTGQQMSAAESSPLSKGEFVDEKCHYQGLRNDSSTLVCSYAIDPLKKKKKFSSY